MQIRELSSRVANLRYLGVAAVLVAAFVTLPVAGSPVLPGGEFHYQAAMTLAFREHFHWGSQVVWTYGPYGYMNEPFFLDFNTWALAFAANLAAHIAFFGVLALFLFRIGARPWLWLLMSLVVVLSFERYPAQFWERFPVLDHKAALVAVLLLYLATEARNRKEAALLAGGAGLVIGYLFADKGTYMLVGLALVGVYLVLSLSRSRALSFVALGGGVAVGYLGLWLLDGQSISDIPGYFRTSYEIIAGYTPAESWFRESGIAHPTLLLGLGLGYAGRNRAFAADHAVASRLATFSIAPAHVAGPVLRIQELVRSF